MNVLVYSGPGSSGEATKQTIECLRLLLSPHYAVTTISELQIINEPWAEATRMLVIPGGADLPICKVLNGPGNTKIKSFVRKGGVYFGICAGAYYGAQQCLFEQGTAIEVTGPRELAFYKGAARGAAYKGFRYASNLGSRAARVSFGDKSFRCFFNGGPMFEGDDSAQVVLKYVDPVECNPDDKATTNAAAAVVSKVGSGYAILSGVHLEYSMDTLHAPDLDQSTKDAINEDTQPRLEFLRDLLRQTGLKVSSQVEAPLITPLYLTCMDSVSKPTVSQTMRALSEHIEDGILQDSNDSFTFCDPQRTNMTPGDKIVGVFDDDVLPPSGNTPYFNLNVYYRILAEQQQQLAVRASGLGRVTMYGEVVTSTSTMIDRNPKMVKSLPHGFVIMATQQVAGRGRGSNVWVNPTGVVPVSGVLKVAKADLRQSLVFVQYLISVAIVDAVYSINDRYRELDLRLKWPNDIYIAMQDGSYSKIGGLLVVVSFVGDTFALAFGAGTNVSNKAPSTSLNTMIDELNKRKNYNLPHISSEDFVARMLARLDEMWVVFLDLGFRPFEAKYYEYWLHTNKIVRLDQYENQRALIKGVSPENGMLVVQAVDSMDRPVGTTYELLPDGNSFDMLKGLIKKKT